MLESCELPVEFKDDELLYFRFPWPPPEIEEFALISFKSYQLSCTHFIYILSFLISSEFFS